MTKQKETKEKDSKTQDRAYNLIKGSKVIHTLIIPIITPLAALDQEMNSFLL